MANLFENPDIIAQEALMHLEDALTITRVATRDATEEFQRGMKIGDTYRIKTLPEGVATEFTSTITVQDIRESVRPLTIEKHFDYSVGLSARDMALEFEDFSAQVLKPAAYKLAEKVEGYVGTKILNSAGQYNSGSLFATVADLALARKEANYQQLNRAGRFVICNNDFEAALLGLDYFNRADTRGDQYNQQALAEGFMARTMGFDFYASLHMPTQSMTHGDGTATTNNTGGTTNLVGHTTLVCTAITAGTGIKANDRIRIAGVRRPLKVAANAAAAATSITLSDPITEIIPDGAAITVIASGLTTELKAVMFDGRGLGVAFPPLDLPVGSNVVAGQGRGNGLSIRMVRGYNMETKLTTMSLDLLCGAECIDPRHSLILTKS